MQFLDALSLPINKLNIFSTNVPDYFHPGRSATFKLGKKIIAYFGQLNPMVLNDLNFKKECLGFEIFLDNLPAPRNTNLSKPLLNFSPFKPFYRDFAFVMDQNLEAVLLVKTIKNVDTELINDVDVFDLYEGENIPEGKKSIALSVKILPVNKTLTEKEIELLSTKIISKVKEKLNGYIREN